MPIDVPVGPDYVLGSGDGLTINLSGGVLRPDNDANSAAYGASASIRHVLFANTVAVPAAAEPFVRALREESRGTTGRRQQ